MWKKFQKRKKKQKDSKTARSMADVEMGEVSESRKCYGVCGVGVFST
jgi:hypothetical protein